MAIGSSAEQAKLARVGPALERIDGLLHQLAKHGLQRATGATLRDMRAVAQTAHHARLVRLERELEGLSTQLQRYLSRDPSFRSRSFVDAANRIWLLCHETRGRLETVSTIRELERFAGIPRRSYEPVQGTRDVVCVAASGWVTDSGFVGVTAHMYMPNEERFVQASMVRPERMTGPNPVRLLRVPVTDVSAMTMQELCHGAWTLDGVRESSDGRLSLHRELTVVPGPQTGRAALDALSVSGAEAILDRLEARALDPVTGLGRQLVLIEPVAFGALRVDETYARATCAVRDQHGAVMRVGVPIRPQHDVLIENLRLLSGPWAPAGLVAEASLSNASIRLSPLTAVFVEPVTIGRRVRDTHLVHLTLEPLERATR